MAKRTKTSVSKSLDKLWSQIVRAKYPFCVKCSKPTSEAHHIHGRRAKGTRWEITNGIGLCAYCHKWSPHGFEQDPYNKENMEILKRIVGIEELERLQSLSVSVVKHSLDDLLELEKRLKEMLAMSY